MPVPTVISGTNGTGITSTKISIGHIANLNRSSLSLGSAIAHRHP